MTVSDPIYGTIEIIEPVLLELIATPAMQRLKGVDQNSVGVIAKTPWGKFTRFDHCVGVMFLIRKLGGGLEEQISGLLHDISHTAFSHAMDFAFGSQETQDFHEKHLTRIIHLSNIPAILKKYGYETDRILDHHLFPILEQDIPALCADRVDYALKTFSTSLEIPIPRLQDLMDELEIADKRMVFRTTSFAKDFAELFLRGDQEIWGGSYIGNSVYHLFGEIVKAAADRGELTLDDFFTTDEEFLRKLGKEARRELEKLQKSRFVEVNPSEPYDLHVNAKIRYVDPPVKTPQGVKKLSELNGLFREDLKKFLERRKQGNYVKILS